MNPQPIIGGIALRILSPRDWLELSREWLSKEQAKLEASMKRAGAAGIDVAREVERFAESHSTFSVLVSMCRNLEGSLMIIDRAASRAGVSREALDDAMVGLQPEELMMCAYRCMGFKVASDEDGKDEGKSPNA
jgi:hypothetical protein